MDRFARASRARLSEADDTDDHVVAAEASDSAVLSASDCLFCSTMRRRESMTSAFFLFALATRSLSAVADGFCVSLSFLAMVGTEVEQWNEACWLWGYLLLFPTVGVKVKIWEKGNEIRDKWVNLTWCRVGIASKREDKESKISHVNKPVPAHG